MATKYIASTLQRRINGVDYDFYPETITDQVKDADGVSLTEILANLATNEELDKIKETLKTFAKVYRLRAVLRSDPSTKAIDKLYEHVGMEVGDVYLVESDVPTDPVTLEQFVYIGGEYGWQFIGTTFDGGSGSGGGTGHTHANKAVLDLIPSELGLPGTFLMVSDDGTSLEFNSLSSDTVNSLLGTHNTSSTAHNDIRAMIHAKADTLEGYEDVLLKSEWKASTSGSYFVYKYTNVLLTDDAYFNIIPSIDYDSTIKDVIRHSKIDSSFAIDTDEDGRYCLICAKYKPSENIPIFVQLFSKIIQK